MSQRRLKEIVSILKESPLYKTLSGEEKRAVITKLAESYSFLNNSNDEDIVGYESGWADTIDKQR